MSRPPFSAVQLCCLAAAAAAGQRSPVVHRKVHAWERQQPAAARKHRRHAGLIGLQPMPIVDVPAHLLQRFSSARVAGVRAFEPAEAVQQSLQSSRTAQEGQRLNRPAPALLHSSSSGTRS